MNIQHSLYCAIGLLLMLGSCANVAGAREPTAVAQLQTRLDAAGSSATCEAAYQTSKAQAWLDFAKYAAHNDAPTTVLTAALRNAASGLDGLETHVPVQNETRELPGSRHERDDLWRTVDAVKENEGRLCAAPRMTAYCEVQLAWVGYEAAGGGWRHVDPYVRMAEDYCFAASHAMPVPSAAAAAPEPAAPPVSVDGPSAPGPVTVFFPHNRAGHGDILGSGHADLQRFVADLQRMPHGSDVIVTGHADLTGRLGYNRQLSAHRARSVVSALVSLGVRRSQIEMHAKGSVEPRVACTATRMPEQRRAYLACLAPNRRVTVRLRAAATGGVRSPARTVSAPRSAVSTSGQRGR